MTWHDGEHLSFVFNTFLKTYVIFSYTLICITRATYYYTTGQDKKKVKIYAACVIVFTVHTVAGTVFIGIDFEKASEKYECFSMYMTF